MPDPKKTRIYEVQQSLIEEPSGDPRSVVRLIRAPSQDAVERAVARQSIKVRLPDQDRLLELGKAGVEVEALTDAQFNEPGET